jgi:hypothetical protein
VLILVPPSPISQDQVVPISTVRQWLADRNHAPTESGFNLVKHELGTGCARAIRAEMTAASFEYIEGGGLAYGSIR